MVPQRDLNPELFKLRLGASIPWLVGRSVGRLVFNTKMAISLLALSTKQNMAIHMSGLSSKQNMAINMSGLSSKQN